MSAQPPEPGRPRLNAFAFPPDTDSRFLLLIVSVVGASLVLSSLIYEAVPLTRDFRQAHYIRCRELADPYASTGSYLDRMERALQSSECTRLADHVEAAAMLGGVALVLVVAGGLYWTAPMRKLRRERLQPLSADDAPDLVAQLAELCRTTGLSQPPTFVWNPLVPTASGSTFGRLGRYSVALSGGLVTQWYTDPPLFRAIVLHELAHLRNGDVDRTYVALAVWQAFLLLAVATLACSALASQAAVSDLLSVVGRVLPLALLVYLMRNAVLRARETYADVRASVWDGSAGALRRALQAAARPSLPGWRRILSVHPDPAARQAVLSDTSSLFQTGAWNAFAAGVTAGIAFPDLDALLELVVPFPWSLLRPFGAALLIAPLLVGVVGLDIWRATCLALIRRTARPGVTHLGLTVGLGFALGQTASLGEAFPPFLTDERTQGAGALLLVVRFVWAAVLAGVLAVFFRWIAAGASTWLEVAWSEHSPRQICAVGLTVASGLLVVWLGVLFVLYIVFRWTGALVLSPEFWEEIQVLSDSTTAPSTQVFESTGFSTAINLFLSTAGLVPTVTVLTAWALPLAPWGWRKRIASTAGAAWAFLEPAPEAGRPTHQPPVRPDLAVAMGVLSAAAFCGVSLVAYVGLYSRLGVALVEALASVATSAPQAERWAGLLLTWIWIGQPVLAGVLLVATATVVMRRVGRLQTLHALCAASVGGWLMLGGAAVLLAVFGLLAQESVLESVILLSSASGLISMATLAVCAVASGASTLVGGGKRFARLSAHPEPVEGSS